MKVLIANKYFFRKGGSEAVMFMERAHLQSVGVEVVDFSMHDPRNEPSRYVEHFVSHQSYDDGGGAVQRIAVALKTIHSPEAVRRVGELIDRARPDLMHCHNIYHQLTPSIIAAAKRRGVPVILTLHDYKVVCPVYTRLRHGRPCSACLGLSFANVLRHRCAGSLSRSAVLYAEAVVQRARRSYEQADLVIAPSEFMRAAVTQRRFPADRVQVVYNGVDVRRIRPADEDEGYALYLGRLSPEKGVETLLAAHDGIAAEVPLRVAGTGPLAERLRAQYPRARYLGHLTGAPLEEAIRKAGVIVVPSEWYENCPISVLEAMAHGKAVLASRIGGIPELVVDGETGLLFPPGDRRALADALLTLTREPALRRALGAAGRRRAERHFSLESHNAALERLYAAVLAGREARRSRDPLAYPSTVQE